jgi:hypothetical protein
LVASGEAIAEESAGKGEAGVIMAMEGATAEMGAGATWLAAKVAAQNAARQMTFYLELLGL